MCNDSMAFYQSKTKEQKAAVEREETSREKDTHKILLRRTIGKYVPKDNISCE